MNAAGSAARSIPTPTPNEVAEPTRQDPSDFGHLLTRPDSTHGFLYFVDPTHRSGPGPLKILVVFGWHFYHKKKPPVWAMNAAENAVRSIPAPAPTDITAELSVPASVPSIVWFDPADLQQWRKGEKDGNGEDRGRDEQ